MIRDRCFTCEKPVLSIFSRGSARLTPSCRCRLTSRAFSADDQRRRCTEPNSLFATMSESPCLRFPKTYHYSAARQTLILAEPRHYPKLQILTVAELLEGKGIDMPPLQQVSTTFKKAPKVKGIRHA